MRASGPPIHLPEFPARSEWLNVPFLRASTLLGRSIALVWFWDMASLNALRALPYVRDWDRRYRPHGLRVVAVHSPQFDFGRERANVERAVRELGIAFAALHDPDYETWRIYGAEVWPSLYLWDRRGVLRWFHFGEGEYQSTEQLIGELLREIDAELELPPGLAPVRDTDRDGALVRAPTPHSYLEPDRSARPIAAGDELAIAYEAATAAAVLDGSGEVEVELDGERLRTLRLDGPRLYTLWTSPQHEHHELRLRFHHDARAYAFSFAAGPA